MKVANWEERRVTKRSEKHGSKERTKNDVLMHKGKLALGRSFK